MFAGSDLMAIGIKKMASAIKHKKAQGLFPCWGS
jgi:hypothetical protein